MHKRENILIMLKMTILASAISGALSGSFLFLAEKADIGVKGKWLESKEILSRIVLLQWRQQNIGKDSSVAESKESPLLPVSIHNSTGVESLQSYLSVSYTHLTLPTIYSV